MLYSMDWIRIGNKEPSYLKYGQWTTRAFRIEISKYRDVEKMHCGAINSLDIENVEGRYLLSGSSDGSIAIHDLHNLNGKPQYTCKGIAKINRSYRHSHKNSIETVQWYPMDTGTFTSSGMDGHLKIWDTNTLKQTTVFNFAQRIYQHNISSFTSSRRLIAIGKSASQVNLLDVKSGSITHELRGHRGKILTVRWSNRDEHLLASGSTDNRILLWDIRSSKSFLCSLDQHKKRKTSNCTTNKAKAHDGNVSGLCFTSDGLQLLSLGTDHRLRLWDMCSGSKVAINFGKVPTKSKKSIKFDVSYNCDHNAVYVPSDRDIKIFNLLTGKKVKTLQEHGNVVNTCVYHPYHQELYSGGNDRNILVWTADRDQTDNYEDYLRSKVPKAKQNTVDDWSSEED